MNLKKKKRIKIKRGEKPDARPEVRLIEDGGMKERRDGEREEQCPPSVPCQGCSQLLICCGFY